MVIGSYMEGILDPKERFFYDPYNNNISRHCAIIGKFAYFIFFTVKIILPSRVLAIPGPSFFHIHFRISFPCTTKNCLFVFGRNGIECLLSIEWYMPPFRSF